MTSTLRRAGRRRWLLLVVAIVPVTLGVLDGTASVGPRMAALLLIGALAVHFGLGFLAGRARGGTALILASILLDISIATAPLALTGDRTLSALLLLAVVPYAFDQDRVHPALLVLAGWLALGAGIGLYAWGTAADVPYTSEFAVSAYVFLAVAGALAGIGAGLRRRIGATQARLAGAAAESGNGRAGVIDDLGRLDRDLTVVLQRVETVASGVRRDVGDMAALGGQLAAAVAELQAHTEVMATASNDLSRDLGAQRALGAEAREKGDQAAAQTEAQRIRADQLYEETTRLVSTAGRARERVARTSETLLSVGAEVRDTAAIVVELKGMSARIAKFAQTIARIGRQTHLLALNAAIEAARSDAAGQGFAVVAEEVRALAAQAGRSARDVAELVGDLQAGIDAAAKAMASGGAQVAGIDAAAREADHALRELEEGVQRTAERALQTAGDGREQTARLNELARILTRLAEQTHGAAATAATGAAGAAGQLRAMGELGTTAQRLVELTDLLRSTAPMGRGERQG